MIVGILGPSFCGSTLLERMLSRCDGITAIGEAHWIMDGGPQVRIGTEPRGRCLIHEPCPTWTNDVLRKARAWSSGSGRWYDILARLVGARFLVVADKNVYQWERFGWPDAAIFPYRPAQAMIDSYVRRGITSQSAAIVMMGEWSALLSSCTERRIPLVEISTHELSNLDVFRRKMAIIGLTVSEEAMSPWNSTACFFGGNPSWRSGFGKMFRPEVGVPPAGIVSLIAELRTMSMV